MNLFVSPDEKCLSSRGPAGEVRQSTALITRSQRQKASQWLRSAPSRASDWAKWDPGCPRRRFGHFFAVEKVTRVWAGQAQEKPGGAGARSPRKALAQGRVDPASFPPARRKANQPFGGQGGPGKAGAPRPPAAKLEKFFSLCRNSPGFPRENPTLFFFERLKCARIVLY